jgi:hypothetical protein
LFGGDRDIGGVPVGLLIGGVIDGVEQLLVAVPRSAPRITAVIFAPAMTFSRAKRFRGYLGKSAIPSY